MKINLFKLEKKLAETFLSNDSSQTGSMNFIHNMSINYMLYVNMFMKAQIGATSTFEVFLY